MDRSLADQAYSAIKKDILTCVLDPGTQIAQSQLVECYDYGMTPIREALKRLEHEGYVRSIPRFGYVITPITVKDVEDLYDLRLILEPSAVRIAIQRASDDQLAQIRHRADFTYIHKDRETYLKFLEYNIGFHVAVALASGNRKLAEMVANVLNGMTRIFNLGLDLRDSGEEMRHEHVALSTALQARDTEHAVRIISDQITRSRQRVMEEFIERLDQRVIKEIIP